MSRPLHVDMHSGPQWPRLVVYLTANAENVPWDRWQWRLEDHEGRVLVKSGDDQAFFEPGEAEANARVLVCHGLYADVPCAFFPDPSLWEGRIEYD